MSHDEPVPIIYQKFTKIPTFPKGKVYHTISRINKSLTYVLFNTYVGACLSGEDARAFCASVDCQALTTRLKDFADHALPSGFNPWV